LLARAERCCTARKSRLTAQRRRVLEIVAGSHAALGAYEIQARMREGGRPPAPVSVYRALDFLISAGLVHRVESLNAYVACLRPTDREAGVHRAQFLICQHCRRVTELHAPDIDAAIAAGAASIGFAVAVQVVEVSGSCPHCLAALRSTRPEARA
jgi:Fur family zinc uptake transcriptional regulator